MHALVRYGVAACFLRVYGGRLGADSAWARFASLDTMHGNDSLLMRLYLYCNLYYNQDTMFIGNMISYYC
jgi:hypothetical protein